MVKAVGRHQLVDTWGDLRRRSSVKRRRRELDRPGTETCRPGLVRGDVRNASKMNVAIKETAGSKTRTAGRAG